MIDILKIVIFYLLMPQLEAFVISGHESCYGNKIYPYVFNKNAIIPDISVKVSKNAIMPDITMKLVNRPEDADLIFVDNYSNADMHICKKNDLLSQKVIKVSENIIIPDITIKLALNPIFIDYKIYVHSYILTKEEAAAIFAIIWKQNRNK